MRTHSFQLCAITYAMTYSEYMSQFSPNYRKSVVALNCVPRSPSGPTSPKKHSGNTLTSIPERNGEAGDMIANNDVTNHVSSNPSVQADRTGGGGTTLQPYDGSGENHAGSYPVPTSQGIILHKIVYFDDRQICLP